MNREEVEVGVPPREDRAEVVVAGEVGAGGGQQVGAFVHQLA